MNRKGFMMAELVVVSAVIIGIMTTFFVSYNKIIARYNKIIYYYDVGTVYRLGNYYKQYKTNFKTATTAKEDISYSEKINSVTYNDKIYYGTCNQMKNYQTTDELVKDYINFFKGLENISEDKNCVILKSCQVKSDVERCKFSYMEVTRETT